MAITLLALLAVPLVTRAVTVQDEQEQGLMPATPIEHMALVAPSGITLETPKPKLIPATKTDVSTTTALVKQMVVDAFPDAPIMVHIADSESQFIPWAQNPHSTAHGVFQILIGTWNGYGCTGDRSNAADNIACARIIYDASGTTPWNASKHNWGKYATI